MTIEQIKKFISVTSLPETIRVNEGEVLNDVAHFFKSHLSILEADSSKQSKMPYYNRVIAVIKLIKMEGGQEEETEIPESKSEPVDEEVVESVKDKDDEVDFSTVANLENDSAMRPNSDFDSEPPSEKKSTPEPVVEQEEEKSVDNKEDDPKDEDEQISMF